MPCRIEAMDHRIRFGLSPNRCRYNRLMKITSRDPSGIRHSAVLCACLVALLMSAPAQAAPEEIQVYLDDLVGTGNFGMDVHNNYVVSGSETPDYPGGETPDH